MIVNWNILYTYGSHGSGWLFAPTPIPDAARSPATQFRWRQLSHGGAAFDHWALDDVKIYLGPAIPIITRQPQSQSVTGGSDVSFTVEAIAGGPLTYYWVFNDYVILREPLGLLRISVVVGGDAGTYYATATRDNGGTTRSVHVVLNVQPPLYCAHNYTGMVSWWPGKSNPQTRWEKTNDFHSAGEYWKGLAQEVSFFWE